MVLRRKMNGKADWELLLDWHVNDAWNTDLLYDTRGVWGIDLPSRLGL